MGRKDGLVLPEDGLPAARVRGMSSRRWLALPRKRREISYSAWTKGPSTSTSSRASRGSVASHRQREGSWPSSCSRGVARVAPDRFVGVQRLEVADEGQQLPLVGRLHRLAPQQGQPRDVVGLAGGEDLVAHLFGERGAVAEVPGHFVETAGAPVGASRHKQAGAHAGTVAMSQYLMLA